MPANVRPKRRWIPTDKTVGNRRDVESVSAKGQAEAEAALKLPWVHSDWAVLCLVPFLQLSEEKPHSFLFAFLSRLLMIVGMVKRE